MKCDFLLTRILSVFNLLKRVGFAVLLLGRTVHAQPYEPTFLLDVTGEVGLQLGFNNLQALGDQNGDGFDDFLTSILYPNDVAALRLYFGNDTRVADYLEFGRFDSLDREFFWRDAAFDAGFTVPAGDVNGDGYPDILRDLNISYDDQPHYYPYLFLGGPGVFDTLADWSGDLTTMRFITNVGDYSGDGRDDYTMRTLQPGSFAFFQGGFPLSNQPMWSRYDYYSNHMGFGDLNNDGYSDFGRVMIAGDSGFVRTEVYLGSSSADSVPALTRVRPQFGTFEFSHRIVGDLNGDGFDDIISRATSFETGALKYVYWGSETMDLVEDVELHWPGGPGANVPLYAAPLGDINGDGYDDCAHYEDYLEPPNDHIEVWLGGNPLPSTPAWVLDGPLDGMNYPYRIGQAGDFNGDGIDDWFFSAYHGLEQRGRIIVVAGDRNFGLAAHDPSPTVPQKSSLSAFPNPFNSTLSISLEIPLHQDVTLSLYDLLGREVDVVYRGRLASSTISYVAPASLSSGVYFLRAAAGERAVLKKVVLLK